MRSINVVCPLLFTVDELKVYKAGNLRYNHNFSLSNFIMLITHGIYKRNLYEADDSVCH